MKNKKHPLNILVLYKMNIKLQSRKRKLKLKKETNRGEEIAPYWVHFQEIPIHKVISSLTSLISVKVSVRCGV